MRRRVTAFGGIAFFVIGALSSSGCSSSAAEDENAPAGSDRAFERTIGSSGSRLRARFVGSGNAKLLVGFRDNERNEDCTFQSAESGRIRCLPESLRTQTGSDITTFSDATCQTPVLLGVVPTCSDVKYAIRSVAEPDPTCGITRMAIRDIRKRDANVPVTTYTATSTSGTSCTAQPPSSLGGQTGQPQGSPAAFSEVVPWSAFVEATETTMPLNGGAILERVLVATDGARQHIGYRALLNGAQPECSFHVMADGITRCVPDKGLNGPVAYSDAACKKPLFVRDFTSRRNTTNGCLTSDTGSGSTATDTTLWTEPSFEICGGISAVYGLGELFTESVSSVFSWDAKRSSTNPNNPTSTGNPSRITVSCALESVNPPTSSPDSRTTRSVTSNLTGALPSSRRWQNGGRGARLVSALVPDPNVQRRDGFENQLQHGFHDSERNVDCTFELAADGKIRCLPVAASAVVFNTDQECQSPATIAVLSASPCVATPKFARVAVPGTCPAVTKIYALADVAQARDVPNVSTRVAAESCARVQQVIGAVDATEIDPAQFVEGAAITE